MHLCQLSQLFKSSMAYRPTKFTRVDRKLESDKLCEQNDTMRTTYVHVPEQLVIFSEKNVTALGGIQTHNTLHSI